MSGESHLILLANYNTLMNRRSLAAAERLSDAALRADKGAFSKSVAARSITSWSATYSG